MNKIIFVIFIFSIFSINLKAQFIQIEFETDSTKIKLTKNSLYKIWEETYKNKDSVFYSVTYINDTTQSHIIGWHRKNGDYFGRWSEYMIDGTWLYDINYTNNTWKYNKEIFKYQDKKDRIKDKADSLIISKFGSDFFKNNVVFRFQGGTYLNGKYLGSWIEPIKSSPDEYYLNYTIKLGNRDYYDRMLQIKLDSTGKPKFEPDKFQVQFNEIVVSKMNKFVITSGLAIELCKQNPIKKSSLEYETNLRFGWRKLAEYPAQFYYEVSQLYDEVKNGDCKPNCEIVKYYNLWRFNPWTTELIFIKPMKTITRFSKGCGYTGNYLDIE